MAHADVTSQRESTRVAIIEDDDVAAMAALRTLQRAAHQFHVTVFGTLRAALASPELGNVDAVVLDLELPDSSGVATLDALRKAFDIPVVVMTGDSDPELPAIVLRHGAQDYVPKSNDMELLLPRAVFYAAERGRLQRELERTRATVRQAREQTALGDVGKPRMSVTADLLGDRPLRQSSPEGFAHACRRFEQIVDRSLAEQRYHKVGAEHRAALRELAAELGELRVGPQDVIELYRAMTADPRASEATAGPRLEEARLTLIGLLGYVMAYYRLRAIVQEQPAASP
jgi:CheY-like chemotaxis protein